MVLTENKQWLQTRRGGIGGSDIGAIIGLDKYKSPLDVYFQKVEGVQPEDNAAMRRGRALEEYVAQEFALATGFELQQPEQRIVEHPNCDFFLASVDRILVSSTGERGVLECKTSARQFDRENIPQSWVCQLQWYLYVLDLKYGAIAWVGPNFNHDFVELERDDEFIEYMVQEAIKFWDTYIIPRVPPEPRTANDVRKVYPRHTDGKAMEVTPEAAAVVVTYKSLAAEQKAKEEQAEGLKERIITIFGDAEAITYQGLVLATFKAPKDTVKFNMDAFKADHPEYVEQYQITVPNSRRLLFKK